MKTLLSRFVEIEMTRSYIEDVYYLKVKILNIEIAEFILGRIMNGELIIRRVE